MMPAPLADACPATACHPGDHPAVAPSRVLADPSGVLVAAYSCARCGCCWRTQWMPGSPWPLSAGVFVHGVSAAEAALNRSRLLAGLDEAQAEIPEAA